MGQKTHPKGFRLGISENWNSRWYAKAPDYAKNALEDLKIRKFLRKKLKKAGLWKIEIERSIASLKITVFVGRPGLVIGRGGAGVEELKKELSKLTKSKLSLDVTEVKNSETRARLVAENIAFQIERRIHVKRAMKIAATRVMEKGAKGVKIVCSGVLRGPSSIARKEKVVHGSVPTQTLRAEVDFARATAFTTYGTIGVKVWIYKGEKEI